MDKSSAGKATSAGKAKNIIEAARKAGNFKTLLSALEAADLTDTLAERNNTFTVFAPTDDAFSAVDKNTLDGLLKPSRKKDLQRILKHHVVRGRIDAKAVSTRKTIRPMDGGEIPVRQEGANVFVGAARVTQTDVQSENGIIHVIDAVLMPETVAAK